MRSRFANLTSQTALDARLQVGPQLEEIFNRGLVKASHASNAWVFTGGACASLLKASPQAGWYVGHHKLTFVAM